MNEAQLLARFGAECQAQRTADTYLVLARARGRARAAAEQLAAAYLETSAPPAQHPECVVFDPAAFGVSGLKVEHVADRGGGEPSLEQALRYRPTGAGRRAVLWFEADRMGPDAQAALLKTSEEPPAGTLLFLTAADLGPLLPALRSRCRTYRLSAWPEDEAQRRAAAAGLEGEQVELLRQATGSVEAALELPGELRAGLLQLHAALRGWLEGAAPADWLEPPAGAAAAEQRQAGQRNLAACLGWLARELALPAPGRAERAHKALALVRDGLVDLGTNITPALVFEDLRQQLERAVPAP